MSKTFHLQVLTPEQIIFDDQITSLIAPGTLGYLGILADHAPLITTLKSGKFLITDKNNDKHFYLISGGFMEVYHNEVSLLIESIQTTEPFDMVTGI